MVIEARAKYLEKVGRKPIHRLLFETLLPYPNRLRLAARSVALGKKTGLSSVAQALGLLKIFGPESIYTEGVAARLSDPPFRNTIQTGDYAGKGDTLSIAYFIGCGADILNQKAAEATLRILKTIAKRVRVMDNNCCGLPPHVYGDLRAARKMATRNLNIMEKETFDILVTDCSSCASFLKKYPMLFEADPIRHKLAERMAGCVKDMVEIMAQTPGPEIAGERKLTVTYHDPCHASRGQGLVEEPRNILMNLPGITFREMPEADWCCGGAGAYALSHQSLSQKVLDRKMANFKKTNADILVTSCPACIIHLSYGMRRHGLTAKVCHISEMGSLTTDSSQKFH